MKLQTLTAAQRCLLDGALYGYWNVGFVSCRSTKTTDLLVKAGALEPVKGTKSRFRLKSKKAAAALIRQDSLADGLQYAAEEAARSILSDTDAYSKKRKRELTKAIEKLLSTPAVKKQIWALIKDAKVPQ